MKPSFLRHTLLDLISRARLIKDQGDLLKLLQETEQHILHIVKEQRDLLTEKEVAACYPFLNVVKLRHMRARKYGPPFIKFGNTKNARVFYREFDVEKWIEMHEVTFE